jgi:hypothetical protein
VIFFAPGVTRKDLPTDRLRNPSFPPGPARVWRAALAAGRPATVTYLRGRLHDLEADTYTEPVDGIQIATGQMILEWRAPDWQMTSGWTWYPIRPITFDEAMEALA